MSKIVALAYSFLILVQSVNINIEDFSKFNVLMDHAKYHNEVYGDNFFQFLSEHYGEQKASHPNEHKEHEELPFKSHHHMFCQANTAFILVPNLAFQFNYQCHQNIQLNFFYKEPISAFEKPSVFQPPKLA